MSLKPDHDRAPAPVALPDLCRMLRTKTAYGVGERGATWKLGESTSAVYWCLATMEAFGVDDNYCHPHACQPGRACFESAEAGEDEREG